MDYAKEIGKRLRKARDKKNLSLEELAAKTESLLMKSRISNYEQGIRTPGPQEIMILAKVLDEKPAYLMCLDEGEESLKLTPEQSALLKFWGDLPSGWKYYISKKTKQLAEIADTLPEFLRDSITPFGDESSYWEWEKKFEEELRQKTTKRLPTPKNVEPPPPQTRPNKGRDAK